MAGVVVVGQEEQEDCKQTSTLAAATVADSSCCWCGTRIGWTGNYWKSMHALQQDSNHAGYTPCYYCSRTDLDCNGAS